MNRRRMRGALALLLFLLLLSAPPVLAQEAGEEAATPVEETTATDEAPARTPARDEFVPMAEREGDGAFAVRRGGGPVTAVEFTLRRLVTLMLPAAVALAGVGILVMAIIQIVKDVFPVRAIYQRWWLGRNWLRPAVEHARATYRDEMVEGSTYKEIRQRLIDLAAGGDAGALFALRADGVAGQLHAAASAALDDPVEHRWLLRSMARKAQPSDVELVIASAKSLGGDGGPHSSDTDVVDARNRVYQSIQRSLDALQISMQASWSRLIKVKAIILSFIIIYGGIRLYAPMVMATPWQKVVWIAAAILGGFVAPVARDLVVALKSLRDR
ncbi:MAG: hypothetical protein GF405_00305 [Candidatus Eisenbacteria bacterium]|nr:hypothetical protein [Candidatus Eisenbacteria bacterium]